MPTKNTTLAYLAGYFDGEGSVYTQSIHGGPPIVVISVRTGDLESMQLLSTTFGGKIHGEDRVSPSRQDIDARRRMYRWKIVGGRAQEILRELLPFLRAKREVAELALGFTHKVYGVKGVPPVEREIRANLAAKIKAINHRITIPCQLSLS